jgi:phage repressor protein C with HTH and peptisase S24 domain
MEPALRDGDWLLLVPARSARPGQLVVVRDPADVVGRPVFRYAPLRRAGPVR